MDDILTCDVNGTNSIFSQYSPNGPIFVDFFTETSYSSSTLKPRTNAAVCGRFDVRTNQKKFVIFVQNALPFCFAETLFFATKNGCAIHITHSISLPTWHSDI